MKLFCVSDIHSAYDPLIKALTEAGFEKNNPEHLLVICGDVFDRLDQSQQVLSYLRSVNNKYMIKGNHEQLLLECGQRGYPYTNDFPNGTYKTICDLGGMHDGYSFDECCTRTLARVGTFIDEMHDYLETENYIFVHGWLPSHRYNKRFYAMEDFRTATKEQWDKAAWICGPDMAINGYNNTGKIVVFGHWHTSYLWAMHDGRSDFGKDAKFDAFYGDGFIALDGCVAHSGQINCVVLEDELI
jgi:serine/threonine protein phosphatase 1